jgi:uncharacterized protein (DUF433 family)
MTLAGFPRIAVDPAICGGRPIVAGTRVRVSEQHVNIALEITLAFA